MTSAAFRRVRTRRALALAPGMALAAACADAPVAVEPLAPTPLVAAVTCEARVSDGRVTCGGTPAGQGPRTSIFGGQGTLVQLASSNVAYDVVAQEFGVDVTVQNLRAEPIGSVDPDPLEVRVFFHDGPVATSGTGLVEVANADGVMLGTGSNQSFFRYPGELGPGQVSAPRRWVFSVPPSVATFSFRVYVSALTVVYGSEDSVFTHLTATGGVVCAYPHDREWLPWCWGDNSSGQLQTAPSAPVTVPRRFAGPPASHNWSFPGETHACSSQPGFAVFCWGDNSHGQLGTGDSVSSPEPRWPGVAGTESAHWLVLGRTFTCAQMNSGPYDWSCWGSNRFGTLGDGTTVSRTSPVPVADSLQAVSATGESACGVRADWTAVCWGRNDWGQLGHTTGETCGGTPCATLPGEVVGAPPFFSVELGEDFACGHVFQGPAWCWGRNDHGQLAVGSADAIAPPTPVVGGRSFTSVSVGGRHACGIVYPGNDLYCWGWRPAFSGGTGYATAPEPVANDIGEWGQVEAGGEHVCAQGWGQIWYCWGRNDKGQLGDGTLIDRPLPVRVLGQK